MADVAKHAGVSLKSVSRVVNDEPNVSERLRERVTSSITALGFRRNDVAADLASGTPAASIGLIIEDIEDPFYARLARGVERVANEYRHLLLVCSSEQQPERERRLVEGLLTRRVAGIIIVPSAENQGHLNAAVQAGTPIVFADRRATGVECDEVLSDNVGGVRAAMGELQRRGHHRIAFLGTDRAVWTNSQRLAAFRRYVRQHQLDDDPSLIQTGPLTQEAARDAVGRLLALPRGVDAVFAQNSILTIGAWKALREHHDIDLIGFDDFDLAGELHPPVTVIAQDPPAIGERAAELLFTRASTPGLPRRRVILPTKLVNRR